MNIYTNFNRSTAQFIAVAAIFAMLLSALPVHFFVADAQTPGDIPGCTDPAANNYDPAATLNDGRCTYDPTPIQGCVDPAANNYDPTATEDDGSCTYDPAPVLGCMDPDAENYVPAATEDDGSCTYVLAPTYEFLLAKKISDNLPVDPYSPDQFSFEIDGIGVVTLDPPVGGLAKGMVELPIGTYTVNEIGPDGFVADDWTLQWSGKGCDSGNGPVRSTIITVVEDNDGRGPDASGNVCWADNQYRGDDNGTSTDPGSINGYKWNDENGDGNWDSSEQGLPGWTIELYEDSSLSTTTTTDDNGEFWFTDLIPGTYGVCEVQQTGWTQTAPDSDDGCYEVTVDEDDITDIDFGNQEDDGPNQCVPESPAWADAVESSDQGDTKGSGAITDPNRTDPNEALGASDWSDGDSDGFFSLGFGGSIVVSFDSFVPDTEGNDISIHEATNGANYPEETALIEVSQDGSIWYEVGTASNQTDINTRVSYFDFGSTGLLWIKYVRVTDTTDGSLHNDAADGFDLDAVDATETVCSEPQPELQCIVEGYKYDETGAPLSGWEIGLGGEFYQYTLTNNNEGGYVYDTMTDTTDEEGYYCIAEYRTGRDDEPGQNYQVGELMQDGWSFFDVTVDGSSSTPAAGDSFFDVWVDVELPTVGETLRVDFYNQADNNGDSDTYRIEGYVWHDDNENTEWDGFLEELPTEDEQAGWTVRITNGVDTFSTTTDANGFYYFEVPAGTWTITEETQAGWTLITPASGNFVITVPAVVTQSFTQRIFAMLVPTAYAAVVETFGPYNFGNNESSGGGGGGGGGRRSSGGGDDDEDTPEPQVLGEQVSLVPQGAPDTGAGGAAPVANLVTLLAAAVLSRFSLRK